MKTKFDSLSILTLCLFFSVCWCAWGLETARYVLNPQKVATIRVQKNPDEKVVALIELTELERHKFAELSKANIGRDLQVIFSGQVLLQATVRAPIYSGMIQLNKWESVEEAREILAPLDRKNCEIGPNR